jgi:hypothetical protein
VITFTPTRRSQPYAPPFLRPQTPQLSAMLMGRPLFAPNPIDQRRQMEHLAALLTRRRR